MFVVILMLSLFSCSPDDGESRLPENLIAIPVVLQGTGCTCGVACVQSVLYYNGIDFREELLAAELGCTSENGTDIDRIISFLTHVMVARFGKEYEGIEAQKREDITIAELCQAIDGGHPVICCLSGMVR